MDKNFYEGAKLSIPACLGVFPVGISIGLLAVQNGFTRMEIIFMSLMVMAGSAELMAISLFSQGISYPLIVLGTFFINLRHIVMSSSAMFYIKKTPLYKRMIAAFALCDESFAIFSLSDNKNYSFLLGANTALYTTFVGSTVIGTFMTHYLPKIITDSFGIAFYSAFLGMLIPSVKGKRSLTILVILTALINQGLQFFISPSYSIILSMIGGAFIGVFIVNEDEKGTEKEESK